MKKYILLLTAALLLLLTACGSTQPDDKEKIDAPSSADVYKITDIITSLDDSADLSVRVPCGIPPRGFADREKFLGMFANADKEQTATVINYLKLLTSDFKELDEDSADFDSYMMSTGSVRLANDTDTCLFSIAFSQNHPEKIYIILTPYLSPIEALSYEEIPNPRCFEGDIGSFNFMDCNMAVRAILNDTSDMENVAVITHLESKNEKTANKMVTAGLKYVFDASYKNNGSIEASDDQEYDVEITIGSTVYYFNNESGMFSRDDGEEIIVSQLNDDALKWIERYSYFLSE